MSHLQLAHPEKRFYALSKDCVCHNMKMTTLGDVYNCVVMVRARALPLQRRQCRKPERASMRCCALARSRTITVFHINRNSRKNAKLTLLRLVLYARDFGHDKIVVSSIPAQIIETQAFSQHFPAICLLYNTVICPRGQFT